MSSSAIRRTFIQTVSSQSGNTVLLRGWVFHLRHLSKTAFVVLRDCSGTVQCVVAATRLKGVAIKLDDAVEIEGLVHADARAQGGVEVHVTRLTVLNAASNKLPFNASTDLSSVGIEARLEYRPLAVRNPTVGTVFKIQAAILRLFREFLTANRFTEIVTSKLLSSGTEGGTQLFEVAYFDRVAYLAQSPQFYKEHGVAAFERVFETGHVYRAEPHASSRHLTEYCSLDLELGFIESPEEVIELERALLSHMFERLNAEFGDYLTGLGVPLLPSMQAAPVWEFEECLELLREEYGPHHLAADLDPEAERRLCALAEKRSGVPAVFVLGFPLPSRPFYTAPRGESGASQGFDLLFRGVEITSGGQRLHGREALEQGLRQRGVDVESFENHLRMFDLGMPPHGGLAIGLERLTALIVGLQNVRDAVLYPRDRYRLSP
ncbi:MAG TPA: aspartate--tRNA(Asn) ligase [Steroidobacteraceae bacterium]|nr:aspartate--tRNA(Asn) ligase [Steroidobacteraceae bacterium]